jgi:hypothetical protein
MSFFKVNPGDVQSFTVVTNPLRHYTSSSTTGVTGSVYVFARRSSIEKESAPTVSFVDSIHDDVDIESSLRSLQYMGRYANVSGSSAPFIATSSLSFPGMIQKYLDVVNQQSVSARKQKVLDVVRFTPTVEFTSNTVRKLVIKDQLSKYYRTSYPSAHWSYSNYNCLNFFTSSTVPTSSCLLYPNVDGGPIHEGFVSGTYTPSGAISFDFYINPKYRPDSIDGNFKAGTIFHLSSTYALSLVTGSAKDENGRPLTFRLQLQLSHSADIPPSILKASGSNRASFMSGGIATGSLRGYAPSDLVFLSNDNSLKWNNWHHVVVRWGTNLVNEGTGSFNIDDVDKGLFVVPSSTVAPRLFSGLSSPDVLFVGNYFEGLNSGSTSTSRFFGADPALRDGVTELNTDSGFSEPSTSNYRLQHPLNAEVHDLAIRRYYMTDLDITTSASSGPKSIDSDWTSFYLPPFFVEESPFRQAVNAEGGILQTPFFEVDGTTNDPFNVALSFGVAGHYINIENFLRDFASNLFPRAHHMSGVAISNTTETRSANDFLYNQPFVRRRNLLIMPCDDGLFVPSYELLASESMKSNSVDDLGIEELSFIHLDNMLLTSSLIFASDFGGDTTYSDEVMGYTPEQPGLSPGNAVLQHKSTIDRAVASGSFDPGLQEDAPLTIFQRTRDPSSNQVTFFDISNMFYGKRILPGSLELKDASLSGSSGAVSVTLKDNGLGTIYRSDSFTSASTWNSVGTIFYDEGIIAIKSPHLYFFGKEGFEITFKGQQNVHVMSIDVNAPANQLNSSSNPDFVSVAPSPFPNDPEKEFVYITGINFHDDNFNVIMKTQLAQPIIKRHGDRLLFKIKHDY